MSTVHLRRWLTVAAAALLGALVLSAQADPSNKWRIKLNHRADNEGAIVLRVAPMDGTPIDVETKVPANTGENHIAKLIRDALKATLGEGYHVETDDGEDVVIGREGKTPKFEVTLAGTTLTGLDVKIKKE